MSGVLLTPGGRYYALYYLGLRNMRWNPETELLFRDQFEQSEAGAGFYYNGSILPQLFYCTGNPGADMIGLGMVQSGDICSAVTFDL